MRSVWIDKKRCAAHLQSAPFLIDCCWVSKQKIYPLVLLILLLFLLAPALHNLTNVYFMVTDDKSKYMYVIYILQESELSFPQEVFTIPNFKDVKGRHRHNVTMHFPSTELCVLSDGGGTLYVLKTGDRDQDDGNVWKVCRLVLHILFYQNIKCL